MTSAQNPHPWNFRVSHLPQLSLAAVAVLLLAGCSASAQPPQPSQPSTTPVAEATPMFASDEEALAAAEAAYANYISVSDQIARDGGAGAERLQPFVSDDLYEQQRQDYEGVLAKALRTTGASTFDSFRFESYDALSGDVRAYVCLRTGGIMVLNLASENVTPVGRNNDLPLQIVFRPGANQETAIVVAGSDVWSGTNFC